MNNFKSVQEKLADIKQLETELEEVEKKLHSAYELKMYLDDKIMKIQEEILREQLADIQRN